VAPDDPNLSGSVTFQQLPPDGVRTDAVISGLEPSGRHGLHLHEATECDGLAAGSPHFDGVFSEGESPRRHADPIEIDAHLGDLGNAQADEHGDAVLTSVVRPLLTIDDGGRFDIVGRVVVLHRGEDDFTSDSPDNSGGLLACGKVTLLPTE
jgi:Cu-Zn family superoxide dismutase